MKLTVRYWGQIKRAAGRAEEEVEVPEPCTVAGLVTHLARERDESFRRHLLDDGGRPRPSVVVVVGDDQVEDLARPLRDGEAVGFLPPIAGGRGP